MDSYFIFAIVLTVVYILYYAVIIALDLYSKRGTGQKDEEVFDIGSMDATEESVDVSENETGFSIGGEEYDTEVKDVTENETAPVTDNSRTEQKEDTAQTRFEQLKAKAEADMEESVPYLSDAFDQDELYKAMLSKERVDNRPELAWKPIKDEL